MGLSKLAAGCRACPYVDTCDHKRMEALDEIEKQLTRGLYAHLGLQFGA